MQQWLSPSPLCLTVIPAPHRWGNIPLDDAVQFNHLEVVKLLQDYHDSYLLSETQAEAAAETLSKENLESMV
jgi:glutaminase